MYRDDLASASTSGLLFTECSSSPQEWVDLGDVFVRRLDKPGSDDFRHAYTCYRNAQDPVRMTVVKALETLYVTNKPQAPLRPEQRAQRIKVWH